VQLEDVFEIERVLFAFTRRNAVAARVRAAVGIDEMLLT